MYAVVLAHAHFCTQLASMVGQADRGYAYVTDTAATQPHGRQPGSQLLLSGPARHQNAAAAHTAGFQQRPRTGSVLTAAAPGMHDALSAPKCPAEMPSLCLDAESQTRHHLRPLYCPVSSSGMPA